MGKSSPDPSNQPNDSNLTLETPNLFIPALQSSDSEEEDLTHDGYEMLPQDLNDNVQQETEDSEDDSSNEENMEINISNSNIPAASTFDEGLRSEVTELWSTAPNSRLTNIEMDSAKEELVRNAMANFTLPSSAIPQWAKNVPEEEWKQQLIQQINLKK